MSQPIKHFYEFGPFRIDTANRLLLCNGEPVAVKAKAVETLLLLVQRNGEVVGKDELMNQLWPDSFVEEANLTQTIYMLRKALGEGRYIETIPRRGYRFVAQVKDWEEASGDVFMIREQTSTSLSFEEESDGAMAEPFTDIEVRPPAEIIREVQIPATLQQVRAQSRVNAQPRLASQVGSKRRLVVSILAGMLLISTIIIAAIAFWPRRAKAPFTNISLAMFTTTGNVIKAAISPDGKYLAHVVDESGQKSIWLRQVATGKDIQVIAPSRVEWFYGLTFSHDGNYLYYVNQEMNHVGMLYRVPSLGGTPSSLLEDVDSPVTLSPDDKRLAFIRHSRPEGRLMIANVDGSGEQKLTASTPETPFQIGPTWQVPPAWSPDGRTIACAVAVTSRAGQSQAIWGFEVAGGAGRPLAAERWQTVGRMEWLANGSGLLITAATDEANPAQQVWFVGTSNSSSRRITNDLNDYRDVSLTADAKTLVAVTTERKANIRIAPAADVDQSSQLTFTNYDGTYGLSWTPDDKLVYTVQAGGEQNLWLTDLSRNPPVQLTSHAGFNQRPNVSTDGRYVVFMSNRSGSQHLWRIDTDGRHPLELTHGESDGEPSISPDGKWIVYDARNRQGHELLQIGIDGGEPVHISDAIISSPIFSPDGKWLALFYRAEPASPNKIALMPFPAGPVRVLTDLPAHYGGFVWTTDGQGLAYSAKQGGGNIWIQPVDGSAARQLTHEKTSPIVAFQWSRDGRRLAFASGIQISDVVLISDLGR
jgi:Tol biopolymer transport system component/DNA-binding winged helix-turn-helix (wHTH) protein